MSIKDPIALLDEVNDGLKASLAKLRATNEVQRRNTEKLLDAGVQLQAAKASLARANEHLLRAKEKLDAALRPAAPRKPERTVKLYHVPDYTIIGDHTIN